MEISCAVYLYFLKLKLKTHDSSITNIITEIHSKLHSITTLVAIEVYVILWSYVVLTWMRGNRELV